MALRTPPANDAYREGYDRIFGKREEAKQETPLPRCNLCGLPVFPADDPLVAGRHAVCPPATGDDA